MSYFTHESRSLARVVAVILTEKGGFQLQPRLVLVDDVDFEFDAILRGPSDSEGLVVVMQADEGRVPMALSLIRAMSQLMLRSGSMRPLTLVLLSQIQDPVILRELPRSVGSSASAATMTVPCFATCSPCFRSCSQSLKGRRPMSQRCFECMDNTSDPFVSCLLAAARRGESAVEEEVIKAVNAAIDEALAEKPK